jgi:hypothetical protein
MSKRPDDNAPERVDDLDVPESQSEDVKGGAAFDAFLEIEGIKGETELKPRGGAKWGDIVLKRG